eukprot:1329383-Prymnesium_polylepis.1
MHCTPLAAALPKVRGERFRAEARAGDGDERGVHPARACVECQQGGRASAERVARHREATRGRQLRLHLLPELLRRLLEAAVHLAAELDPVAVRRFEWDRSDVKVGAEVAYV